MWAKKSTARINWNVIRAIWNSYKIFQYTRYIIPRAPRNLSRLHPSFFSIIPNDYCYYHRAQRQSICLKSARFERAIALGDDPVSVSNFLPVVSRIWNARSLLSVVHKIPIKFVQKRMAKRMAPIPPSPLVPHPLAPRNKLPSVDVQTTESYYAALPAEISRQNADLNGLDSTGGRGTQCQPAGSSLELARLTKRYETPRQVMAGRTSHATPERHSEFREVASGQSRIHTGYIQLWLWSIIALTFVVKRNTGYLYLSIWFITFACILC